VGSQRGARACAGRGIAVGVIAGLAVGGAVLLLQVFL
jgi:hypothetical protein